METEFEINRYNIKAGLLSCMGLGVAKTSYLGMLCVGHRVITQAFRGTGRKSEVLLCALIIMGYGCLQLQPDSSPSQMLPPWPLWEPEPRWTFRSFTIIVSVPRPVPGLLLTVQWDRRLCSQNLCQQGGPLYP